MDLLFFSFLLFSFLFLPDSSYRNDFFLLFSTQKLHSENPWYATGFMVSILDNRPIIHKKGETLEQELSCLETKEGGGAMSILEVDQISNGVTE